MADSAILQGGPAAGKVMGVGPDTALICVPYAPPNLLDQLEIKLPPYRWWHRLLRRPVPPPPDPPTFTNLVYQRTGETTPHGMIVFRYERAA